MKNGDVLALLRARGEEIGDEVIAWRRVLHTMPELCMDTPKTEAQILDILAQIGITEVRGGVGGHGVCAVIRGDLPGKCLAIRADCDGLPVKEETGLPFASENGNMHACGHDAHTAMALGAAKLLFENRHRLKGTVKLIFQPYEEGDGGAKRMIADGALDNPAVDAIVALHNHCTPDEGYLAGDLLVTDAPITANIYSYEAVFHGGSSHVCLSDQTANAIYMACDAVARIAQMERDGESVNAVSMVHGGVRNNVISESCTVSGTIRAFDRETHTRIKEGVHQILEASARRFGGTVEIKTAIDLMGTEIDRTLYERFVKTANALFPERGAVALKERELIGEDFARFASVVPGLYFKLHTKPEGSAYPLHHPKFDVNEAVLYRGSAVFAAFALRWQDE